MKKSLVLTLACLAVFSFSFSQTVDSVVSETKINGAWQKSGLDIIARDASCNILSVHSLYWDAANQWWVNSTLSTYNYDNPNLLSEVVTKSWDPGSGTWVNSSKSIFFLANDGMTRNYVVKNWDAGAASWVNSYKISEDLDNQGHSIRSEFDLYFSDAWQKIQRSLFTYDADNHAKTQVFQIWNGTEWNNNSKTTFSYTGNDITHDYLWNWGTQDWTKFRRTFNDYIPNTANSTKSFGQIVSGTGWDNNFRSESEFNNANMLLSTFQQFWDAVAQSWVNSMKVKIDYYPDGSQQHYRFDGWDASSNSWNYGFRTYSTDVTCQQTLQIIPVSETNIRTGILPQDNGKSLLYRTPAANTLTAANYGFQRILNPFAGGSKDLVYDFSYNTGSKQSKPYAFELILSAETKPKATTSSDADNIVSVEKPAGFAISPNPARSYINVSLTGWKSTGTIMLKLSDVSGRQVLLQKLSSNTQRVNLPSLQKGLYIVTISSGKEIKTQKLVIE